MLWKFKKSGFSLTEVLLAAGILAIGFMLVATTFPVGIKLTTVATERAIAAVATDEALAKMNIYGVDPNKVSYGILRPFGSGVLVSSRYTALETYFIALGMPVPDSIDALLNAESLYPSTEAADLNAEAAKYNWSALLQRMGVDGVKSVIFVSRKAGAGVRYPDPVDPLNSAIEWPEPIKIIREDDPADPMAVKEIIIDTADEQLARFIADGAVIVDDQTGLRIQVLRREPFDASDVLRRKLILAEAVDETQLGSSFWVIPTGLGSSRNPCVTVEVWDL